MDAPRAARRLWTYAEPVHAVTYFAPEAHTAYERAGLRGFWRGYFAGRAGPLGPVGPEVVTATFYGFHPEFVARALPAVWTMIEPAGAVRARRVGAEAALRRLVPATMRRRAEVAVAAELLGQALEDCDVAGRPIFAGNRRVRWPDSPPVALWHAATLLREHRGDGHVAALAAAGIDGCEAHVLHVVASGAGPDTIQPYRGWIDADWAAATERLRERGWLDGEGALTAAGREAKVAVEDATDRMASEPVERLGADDVGRVIGALATFSTPIVETLIPYPNPMGVPRPPEPTET